MKRAAFLDVNMRQQQVDAINGALSKAALFMRQGQMNKTGQPNRTEKY